RCSVVQLTGLDPGTHDSGYQLLGNADHDCALFYLTAPPPTHIYTLSLHDALPIYDDDDGLDQVALRRDAGLAADRQLVLRRDDPDRKSTRLNSSHVARSYAVFCLLYTVRRHERRHGHDRLLAGAAVQRFERRLHRF